MCTYIYVLKDPAFGFFLWFIEKKQYLLSRNIIKNLLAEILFIYLWIFIQDIASSVLKVNCYQWGSCVGSPSAFNSPFGHRSRSHNICPLDNHLSGLSISLSSLVLSWVYRLPFFKSLVWLGCDSNSQPSVMVASTLPLHYQSTISLFTGDSHRSKHRKCCVQYSTVQSKVQSKKM